MKRDNSEREVPEAEALITEREVLEEVDSEAASEEDSEVAEEATVEAEEATEEMERATVENRDQELRALPETEPPEMATDLKEKVATTDPEMREDMKVAEIDSETDLETTEKMAVKEEEASEAAEVHPEVLEEVPLETTNDLGSKTHYEKFS